MDQCCLVCYSTINYKPLTQLFLDSVYPLSPKSIYHKIESVSVTSNTSATIAFKPIWYTIFTYKLLNLVTVMESSPECEYLFSTDCDIIYYNRPEAWKSLFEYMNSSSADIFFMREHSSNQVNGGFYILKKSAIKKYLPFFKRLVADLIEIGPNKERVPYGDQTLFNERLSELNYDFIPSQYVAWGELIHNAAYTLIHHAVCAGSVDEKIRQIYKVKKSIDSRNTPSHCALPPPSLPQHHPPPHATKARGLFKKNKGK